MERFSVCFVFFSGLLQSPHRSGMYLAKFLRVTGAFILAEWF
jgi:hypothetical protein